MSRRPLMIYNLFPRHSGTFLDWIGWLDHIRAMGFSWIYVNPFHLPGHSGSLYAVKDYALYHPMFSVGNDDFARAREQRAAGDHGLRTFLHEAHSRGLRVAMDLVANHTATDSPLVHRHPGWYRWRKNGRIVHPGARDGRKRVVWGDLAQLDHRKRPSTAGLSDYLVQVIRHYLSFGIDGFRCDAAYKVPTHFWKALVQGARATRKDVLFLGETLGCSQAQVVRVQRAGFDYVFNNFKWWNLQDPGFLWGHNQVAPKVRSIAFPESHDTTRFAADTGVRRDLSLQRYALAAFFSSAVMMTQGYEHGATRKMDVIRGRPGDLEPPRFHLRDDIAYVNHVKHSEPVFQVESPLHWIDLGPGVCAFVKEGGGQRAVVAAHVWGGERPVRIDAHLLGPHARVVYGLRRLEHGALRAALVPGEVFAAVSTLPGERPRKPRFRA